MSCPINEITISLIDPLSGSQKLRAGRFLNFITDPLQNITFGWKVCPGVLSINKKQQGDFSFMIKQFLV